MEAEIHKLIVSRDRKYTNFVEVRWGGVWCSLLRRRGGRWVRTDGRLLMLMFCSNEPHTHPIHTHSTHGGAVPELQAHLPAVRGAVLRHGRGRDGQRAGLPRVDPPLRGAPGRVFPQRLRARHRLQFQQGASVCWVGFGLVVCGLGLCGVAARWIITCMASQAGNASRHAADPCNDGPPDDDDDDRCTPSLTNTFWPGRSRRRARRRSWSASGTWPTTRRCRRSSSSSSSRRSRGGNVKEQQ